MALRMARIATPTSANTASHMFAMPTAASTSTASLTPKANTMFCHTMHMVRRARPMAREMLAVSYTHLETEDTVSVITGDIVQHGDPQDDKTVMEHITENLPIGKKGDK